jgi:hypothetical protein
MRYKTVPELPSVGFQALLAISTHRSFEYNGTELILGRV